jgi:elongation factor P--(R)-beta-lysine ligase
MNKLTPDIIEKRSHFFKSVRDFFYEKGFIEVDTPHLVHMPSLEPYLDPYCVQVENNETNYLITSPEYAMKKILSFGCEKIFEIAHAYRSNEKGKWHAREFLMLEWYWVDSDLNMLIEMCNQLLNKLLKKNLHKNVFTLEQWFELNFNHGCNRNSLEKNLLLKDEDVESMSYEDLFFKLFLLTENKLKEFGLVFLIDYPAELRAYSTVRGNIAERFEIYFNGVELANAFNEERSNEELHLITKKEQDKRKSLNKPYFEIDEDFVNSLSKIEKNITGIALGLDRLFAIYQNKDNLSEVCFYHQNN